MPISNINTQKISIMKIIIAGGSGFVGEELSNFLIKNGHEVCILSRSDKSSKNPKINYSIWTPDKLEMDHGLLKSHDAIINLAGTPINGRWTKSYMHEIENSRVMSTRTIVNALNQNQTNIKVLVNASAMGYFPSNTEVHAEDDAPGDHFLAKVCVAWENEVHKLMNPNVRSAIIRIGVVLDRKGGMLKSVEPIVKLGLASGLGNGKQFMSVIHLEDLCRQFLFIIENEKCKGAFHGVCEEALRNKDFMRTLAQVMKKPFFLPNVPSFVLHLVLGKAASFVLQSFNLSSKKWKTLGFQFKFSSPKFALENLYRD